MQKPFCPTRPSLNTQAYKSFAGFSNFFRYKLLLEKGGWWVDTDVVCLAPFDFPTPYVFASEYFGDEDIPGGPRLCHPQGPSAIRRDAPCLGCVPIEKHCGVDLGETGPQLVAEIIERFSLEEYLRPASVFCPLAALDWDTVLEPGRSLADLAGSHALHLWNEMWRRKSCDKEAAFDSTCIYEQLRRRYLSP